MLKNSFDHRNKLHFTIYSHRKKVVLNCNNNFTSNKCSPGELKDRQMMLKTCFPRAVNMEITKNKLVNIKSKYIDLNIALLTSFKNIKGVI